MMKHESPSASGGTDHRGQGGWRIWLTVAMLALVAAAVVWNQIEMRSEGGGGYTGRAPVDFSTKMWVVMNGFYGSGHAREIAQQTVDGIVGALNESPDDVGLWIRLDVLRAEAGLDLSEPPGTPKRPRGRAIHSFSLVASLYAVSNIQRDWERERVALVKDLDLGPAGTLLEAKVAERAKHPDRAKQLRDKLYDDAWVGLIWLIVAGGLLLLIAMAGIIVWIAHISTVRSAYPSPTVPGTEIPSMSMGFVFALYLFASVIVSGLLARELIGERLQRLLAENPERGLAITLISSGIVGGLGIWIAQRMLKSTGLSIASLGLHRKPLGKNLGRGILGWSASLPLVGVTGLLAFVVFRDSGVATPANPIADALVSASSPVALLLIFALACVSAPVFEEFFFRGVLYGAMRSRWGAWPAIFGSAGVFATLHPQLPLGFLPLFALGSMLAYLREQSGSLMPGMIVHALNNGVALLMVFLALC